MKKAELMERFKQKGYFTIEELMCWHEVTYPFKITPEEKFLKEGNYENKTILLE